MKKIVSTVVLVLALSPIAARAIDWCDYCAQGCNPCCLFCAVEQWWHDISGDGWWEY